MSHITIFPSTIIVLGLFDCNSNHLSNNWTIIL